MKTNVSHTSIDSYHKLIECGKENTQYRTIYNYVLSHAPCSRRDVANGTGLELGAVAGRANLLIKENLLKEEKIGTDKITGRKCKLLEPAVLQLSL